MSYPSLLDVTYDVLLPRHSWFRYGSVSDWNDLEDESVSVLSSEVIKPEGMSDWLVGEVTDNPSVLETSSLNPERLYVPSWEEATVSYEVTLLVDEGIMPKAGSGPSVR